MMKNYELVWVYSDGAKFYVSQPSGTLFKDLFYAATLINEVNKTRGVATRAYIKVIQ